jgi:hypothetical protein
MAVLGLPAMRFLTTDRDEEWAVLVAVARRAAELHELMQKKLASEIVAALSRAMR